MTHHEFSPLNGETVLDDEIVHTVVSIGERRVPASIIGEVRARNPLPPEDLTPDIYRAHWPALRDHENVVYI